MPGTLRKWWWLPALVLAGLVIWWVRPSRVPHEVVAGCPEHEIRIDLGGGIVVDSIAIAPNTAGVPEYHDCQRMLVTRDRRQEQEGRFGTRQIGHDSVTYGPLIALWAAEDAAKLFPPALVPPEPPEDSVVGPTPVPAPGAFQDIEAYAVVQAFNWGPAAYGPLGMAPGFSCLYLWRDKDSSTGWEARLVSLGDQPGPCHDPQPIADLGGQELSVRPVPDGVLSGPDLPPVVRWDRDPDTGHQYIGVRCGQWWCEVGEPGGFHSSRPAVDEAAGSAYLDAFKEFEGLSVPISTRERERVIGVKGWYDQQVLAVMEDGKITPSGVTGTIIPHPALDRAELTKEDFKEWKPAAYIYVDAPYPGKRLPLPQGLTELDLCHGTAAACGISTVPGACAGLSGEAWWGRFRSAGDQIEYRCLWHDATKTVIPAGSARWRWLEDDETTWVRCVEGCCTTQ